MESGFGSFVTVHPQERETIAFELILNPDTNVIRRIYQEEDLLSRIMDLGDQDLIKHIASLKSLSDGVSQQYIEGVIAQKGEKLKFALDELRKRYLSNPNYITEFHDALVQFKNKIVQPFEPGYPSFSEYSWVRLYRVNRADNTKDLILSVAAKYIPRWNAVYHIGIFRHGLTLFFDHLQDKSLYPRMALHLHAFSVAAFRKLGRRVDRFFVIPLSAMDGQLRNELHSTEYETISMKQIEEEPSKYVDLPRDFGFGSELAQTLYSVNADALLRITQSRFKIESPLERGVPPSIILKDFGYTDNRWNEFTIDYTLKRKNISLKELSERISF